MARRLRWPAGTAAVVGALVTYVALIAASGRHGPTAPSAGAPVISTATLQAPPAATAGPSVPAPVQLPTLGISAPTVGDLDRFIATTGTTPEVVDVFEPWSLERPLDREVADAVAARGARLSVTWEPWDSIRNSVGQPRYSLASIIAGDHDAYIDLFAGSIQQYAHPVTIRLMHEMNGNWYPWGSGVNGNRPGQFVAAWRHVHDRFTALGVADVQWLWAPNAVYTGGAPLAPVYPGDNYVDAVGVSNYNWGERTHDGFGTHWRTFDSLFDESIAELTALTDAPVWIAETGSSSNGGSKADWLAQMLAGLQARPWISGLIWFDHLDDRHGVDWRIETEPATAAAWRQGFEARRAIPEQGAHRHEG